jgi:hypothetical protein
MRSRGESQSETVPARTQEKKWQLWDAATTAMKAVRDEKWLEMIEGSIDVQ